MCFYVMEHYHFWHVIGLSLYWSSVNIVMINRQKCSPIHPSIVEIRLTWALSAVFIDIQHVTDSWYFLNLSPCVYVSANQLLPTLVKICKSKYLIVFQQFSRTKYSVCHFHLYFCVNKRKTRRSVFLFFFFFVLFFTFSTHPGWPNLKGTGHWINGLSK